MPFEVEVDASALHRAMRRLAPGLESATKRASMETARQTADEIAKGVPVLTGRLRKTVDARTVAGGGAAVTYGGELPYARKIERRAHAVESGLRGAEQDFARAMHAEAAREVGRL